MRRTRIMLCVILLCSFATTLAWAGKSTKAKRPDPPPKETTVPFEMTPQAFATKFNQEATVIGEHKRFRIDDIKINSGEKSDTSRIMLNDDIGLGLFIDKQTGNVNGIMMIARSDGTKQSAMEMLMVVGLLIRVANPELTTEEMLKLAMGLAGKAAESKGKQVRETVKSTRYSAMFSEYVGFTVTITRTAQKS